MSDWEKTIVPLDQAHALLEAFGIEPSNRDYQRYRREDGFRQVDFEEILGQSKFVLMIDWRHWMQDATDEIVNQLSELGIAAAAELDDDGNQGTIQINGAVAPVKYVPNDDGDFCDNMVAINRLLGKEARYLKFRSCEGSDGWGFAVLKRDNWKNLIATAGETIRLLFKEIQ